MGKPLEMVKGLSYINKFETLMNEKTTYVKLKKSSSYGELTFNHAPKPIECNKLRHINNKCYRRLFKKCQVSCYS